MIDWGHNQKAQKDGEAEPQHAVEATTPARPPTYFRDVSRQRIRLLIITGLLSIGGTLILQLICLAGH